ncbi:MAG: hypothetical protein US49_C0002G0083 [candidate division TM6 bacterium GW2011_GWF2_37_49]|nr:MAG: hypothetical protein US49_C0002G0083 [candidate division TM6 bacterium GW2011_GWF2_37_49]
MLIFKKILILGAFLSASLAYAMQPDIQASGVASTEALQATSPEVQEFENLVQAALTAKKPTDSERVIVGLVRELVRFGGPMAVMLTCGLLDIEFLKMLHAGGLSIIVFTIMADLAIYKRDASLIALRKLEKYITSLMPEQRNEVIALFNDKYASKLNDKIMQEKDSSEVRWKDDVLVSENIVVQRGMVAIFDAIIPLLVLDFLFYNDSKLKPKIAEAPSYARTVNILKEQRSAAMDRERDALLDLASSDNPTLAALWTESLRKFDQYRSVTTQQLEAQIETHPEADHEMENPYQVKPAVLMFVIPALIDALLVLYNNFYNSTDQQKSRALAKINAALK